MSAGGPYDHIRAVIARHGADSPQAARLLTDMVEERRAAAAAFPPDAPEYGPGAALSFCNDMIFNHGVDSPQAAQIMKELVEDLIADTPAAAAPVMSGLNRILESLALTAPAAAPEPPPQMSAAGFFVKAVGTTSPPDRSCLCSELVRNRLRSPSGWRAQCANCRRQRCRACQLRGSKRRQHRRRPVLLRECRPNRQCSKVQGVTEAILDLARHHARDKAARLPRQRRAQ